MTVVDASIVISVLSGGKSDELLRQRFAPSRRVQAPELIDAEVVSGIRGLLLGRKIDHARAMQMLADFNGLRITRQPMRPYLRRVMELRDNFTAYDALYVALAESLQVPLFTRDAKFSRAAGHHADVHVYP